MFFNSISRLIIIPNGVGSQENTNEYGIPPTNAYLMLEMGFNRTWIQKAEIKCVLIYI